MFVQPTIFTDVTNRMRIAQEEVFGPVLSIIGFDTEDDAVEIGNDVEIFLLFFERRIAGWMSAPARRKMLRASG